MSERILTRHPDGKKGVNISAEKYHLVSNKLIGILKDKPEITYKEMDRLVNISLKDKFEGNISWYVVTVKLDLEARGIIERIPGSSPHKIRLKP